MNFVRDLSCVSCGRSFPPELCGTCPDCGEEGILDFRYDYKGIASRLTPRALASRERTQWRYRELLPLEDHSPVPAPPVGFTPLVPAVALAEHLGLGSLFLKDEGRNPTASFKDRASAVAVAKAQEQGCEVIACASTGNAASSLAGLAAASGRRSVIFIPASTPEPKLAQLLVFGAIVLRVQGSYFDAYQLCQRLCRAAGWYNRNCAVNPALIEGKKTAGHEIAEQAGAQMPDWVAVSVGDGCTIAGLWKGLCEFHRLGMISRLPKMLGVQAAGAAPITRAFLSNTAVTPMEAQTVADSICVGVPRNWRKALRAVRESGGAMINVRDEEILAAIKDTGRLAGVFAEPAAATAVAGLRRAVEDRVVPRGARGLAVITGSGLKDTRSIAAVAGCPFDVAADGAGAEKILRERGLLV